MNKQVSTCIKGGMAGLAVGVAVAMMASGKATAGVCLKKNMNRMVKAAGGVVDSLKRMVH